VTKIKTACPLDCFDVCSVIATVENGHITRLDGDPTHPITQGFLCGKGRKLRDRMYASDRILQPQKRVGETWQTISWAQAYEEIAAHMKTAIDRYGHWSILHAYDWGSGAVLKNLNQRFFYLLGGCTETVGSLCWDAGLEAQRYDFGQARSHSPEDLTNTHAVVVWGRNVANTNIHMIPFIKQAQARGARLVVVNPLPTDLDNRATFRVAPRPGTDGLLAMGVLKHCIDQGWLDDDFIRAHSLGFAEYADSLSALTLKDVSEQTEVPVQDIVRLAEIYGTIQPVTTLLGIGLQRYPGGGNAIRAIDALAAATGHVGVPGGGVNYANRMIPEFLDQEALTSRDTANVRPFTRGGQADEIMAATPPIEVMFVTRTNPLTQVPDSARLLAAYATVPCKIVIDMFMTATAAHADYVLPCTSVLEEEDFTFSTMWHAHVSYINRVADPLGETKPDWLIFTELAAHLGIGEAMKKPIDAWMTDVLAPVAAQGYDLATLRARGTIALPVPEVPWQDYQFRTPSGKFEFVSDLAKSEGQSPYATVVETHEIGLGGQSARKFPFALLTIHPRLYQNSQQPQAQGEEVRPVVELSPDVALSKHIADGDTVRVWNEQAEVLATARIRAGGHAKTVKMESGWWGQGLSSNHFTKTYQADFGQQTAQYDCACDIEKCAGN